MNEWLLLDPKELTRPVTKKIGHAKVQVVLSPYDIPRAVRGSYDEAARSLAIEFRYVGSEEPQVAIPQDANITFRVGKRSNRLYRIEVARVDKPTNLMEFERDLQAAFDYLSGQTDDWHRGENYNLAREIVVSKQRQLFPTAIHAG